METRQTLYHAFGKLRFLQDEYHGLGLSWGDLPSDHPKDDIEEKIYIAHYKVWQHAHYIRKLMNEVRIDEPILNGRFQVFFPKLKSRHHEVVRRVLERYLTVKVANEEIPLGFEFTYDHPRFSVSIFAERNNLSSVSSAKRLAHELVEYSSVTKCQLDFKSQAFTAAYPCRPLSVAHGVNFEDTLLTSAC